MALPAAIAIGAASAIGFPPILRNIGDPWTSVAELGTVHFVLVDVPIDFSFPIFGVVTFLVWLLLNAVRNT